MHLHVNLFVSFPLTQGLNRVNRIVLTRKNIERVTLQRRAAKLKAETRKIQRPTQPKDLSLLRNQVTVEIPTLNEAESIGILIDAIRSHGYDKLLVVDGLSTDKTKMVAEERNVPVLMQESEGKAGALLTAFRSVSTEYTLIMDGNGSYDPSDMDKFLSYAEEFDFVKGSRVRNENMPLLNRFGNYIITSTFNMLFGTTIGDVCSGMYLVKTDKTGSISLEKNSLTSEQEITAQMALLTDRLANVPINYGRRIGRKSKKNRLKQGFRYLVTDFQLAKEYNPLLLFSFFFTWALVPAVVLLITGLTLFFLHGATTDYFIASAILFVLGVQGVSLAAVSGMFRKIERRLDSLSNSTQ